MYMQICVLYIYIIYALCISSKTPLPYAVTKFDSMKRRISSFVDYIKHRLPLKLVYLGLVATQLSCLD